MIQYIKDGEKYTTRYRLAEKYSLSKNGGLLQKVLADESLTMIQDRNQFYFLKAEVEAIIESQLKKIE